MPNFTNGLRENRAARFPGRRLFYNGLDGRAKGLCGFRRPRKPARNPSEMGEKPLRKGAAPTPSGDRLPAADASKSAGHGRGAGTASLLWHPRLAQAFEHVSVILWPPSSATAWRTNASIELAVSGRPGVCKSAAWPRAIARPP